MRKLFTHLIALWTLIALATPGLAAPAPVDINHATVAELEALDGIGSAKADAIVAYREKNGPFGTVDDLQRVRGIGVKLLEKLRPQVKADRSAVR